MSQPSNTPNDVADMDDTMSVDAPVVTQQAPATRGTSGRGRGRGRWPRSKANRVTKPPTKGGPGRGRRHKVYESSRLQAAHERCQELKQAYAAVAKLVKPVVQEIADRSINELLENPEIHKQVPEYQDVMSFLRKRRDDAVETCNRRLEHGLAMAEHVWKAQQQKVHDEYTTKLAEMCEDRYGQLLLQLDILEYLHDNNLPIDLPAPTDDRYLFKEISQEDADLQGAFDHRAEHKDLSIQDLMVKPQTLPLEDKEAVDDEPAAKGARAKGAGVGRMPRHPAGLLGAAEDIADRAATPVDSESAEPEADGPEPPLPRGAGDPDQFGVRLVYRKGTKNDIPNNRVMVPNLFEWDDLDIGFRDSTNCANKGATKQRRGKYLNKPGSNYLFVDRRVGIWDSTLAAGELDEDLVKKYRLHPTYGLVVPDSINEWEPPKPAPSGLKPVVFVPPNGDPIHTSRTVAPALLDRDVDGVQRRMELARLIRSICEGEDIPVAEISPDKDLLETHREEVLRARNIDPAQLIQVALPESSSPTPQPVAEDTIEAVVDAGTTVAPVPEDTATFDRFVDEAIAAADAIEAEDEAIARAASAKRTSSRPYDAIRDVFTDTRPSRQPSPPATQDVPVVVADTTNLSRLADTALQLHMAPPPPAPVAVPGPVPVGREPVVEKPVHYDRLPSLPPQPVAQKPVVEEPPRYDQFPPMQSHHPAHAQNPAPPAELPPYGPAPQSNGVVRVPEYGQPRAEYFQPAEYHQQQEPAHLSQQEPPRPPVEPPRPAPVEPHRPNDFLRTALNPPAVPPAPYMPHVQEYPGVPLPPAPAPPMPNQTPATTGRTSYPSTTTTQALPALRPRHNLLNDQPPPPPFPEPQPSPAVHHTSIVPPTNSGGYYPPPATRTYQNGYTLHEPGQPHPPHQPMGTPMHPPPPLSLAPIAPSPLRPMSPPQQPAFHQPPPFGPPPQGPPVGAIQPPVHYPGVQQPLAPAPVPNTRSRPGSSSAPNTQSSSKYRKLEPAPTPPHRLSYQGSNQELRTVQFDYREAIKDYTPIEAPPRHGPTQIRAGGKSGAARKSGGRKRLRDDDDEQGSRAKKPRLEGPRSTAAAISDLGSAAKPAQPHEDSASTSRAVPEVVDESATRKRPRDDGDDNVEGPRSKRIRTIDSPSQSSVKATSQPNQDPGSVSGSATEKIRSTEQAVSGPPFDAVALAGAVLERLSAAQEGKETDTGITGVNSAIRTTGGTSSAQGTIEDAAIADISPNTIVVADAATIAPNPPAPESAANPAPSTANTRRPRTRKARNAPAPRTRSPYNLRSRRGAKTNLP
ncbi:hypothetical protein VTJ49DRAFT_365 [Mycothermus thermophilus]|uniref:Uncharacterized protein n=1 Tax=Humicola insolens TaxID=85995 RepID=A0ABR3VPD1_HUMIN